MTQKPFQLYFQEVTSYLLANLIRSLAQWVQFLSMIQWSLAQTLLWFAIFLQFYTI